MLSARYKKILEKFKELGVELTPEQIRILNDKHRPYAITNDHCWCGDGITPCPKHQRDDFIRVMHDRKEAHSCVTYSEEYETLSSYCDGRSGNYVPGGVMGHRLGISGWRRRYKMNIEGGE